jgi:hypothetical protein
MNELVLVLFFCGRQPAGKLLWFMRKGSGVEHFTMYQTEAYLRIRYPACSKDAINPLYRTASNPHSSKQERDWLRVAGRVEVADAPAVALDPVAVHRHVRGDRCALQQRVAHLNRDVPGQQVLVQLQRIQIG